MHQRKVHKLLTFKDRRTKEYIGQVILGNQYEILTLIVEGKIPRNTPVLMAEGHPQMISILFRAL